MADIKSRIAKRVAKEMHNGDVVNLGIGLPTMVPQFIPDDVIVTLHSENGFAGLAGPVTEAGEVDVDVIDSGGTYVKTVDRVKYFDAADSFGIIRGGHNEEIGRASCRERV